MLTWDTLRILRLTGRIGATVLSIGAASLCARSGGAGLAQLPRTSPAQAASVSRHTHASSADAFVDSIGVNTHFSYTDTVYGRYLTTPAPSGYTVVSALRALGIRHIRDGSMNTAAGALRCSVYRQVFANGADVDAVIADRATTADVADMARCLGPALFAFEGPNELDNGMHYDSRFAAQDVAEMKLLRAARGSAYPLQIKIFGPTTVVAQSNIALAAAEGGAIASYIDYSSGHVYFGNHNPESTGWGGDIGFGVYGALMTDIQSAQSVAPGKPYVTTETGYTDSSDDPAHLDPAVKSAYLLRDLFEHRLRGARYTYIYELAREHGSWGIMDETLTPLPAYAAIQNTISILADPGRAMLPHRLRYTLAAPSDVQSLLLDGSYWLVLWQTDSLADPRTGQRAYVPTASADVSFAVSPTALALFTIEPTTGRAELRRLPRAASIAIRVSGMPEILQIGPSRVPVLHP
jgi:hypothetical protein